MIAEEKAKELIRNFYTTGYACSYFYATRYATIVCDEMINEYENQMLHRGLINKQASDNMINYWREVKTKVNEFEAK